MNPLDNINQLNDENAVLRSQLADARKQLEADSGDCRRENQQLNPQFSKMKILNSITYTTIDGNGQRHEWTTQIPASRKLGTIEAEKILKRDSPSAIVTRIESLVDSR